MANFLCDECKKKHIIKEEDINYNLYCFHSYMDMKKKSIEKAQKRTKKQKNELPVEIIIDSQ